MIKGLFSLIFAALSLAAFSLIRNGRNSIQTEGISAPILLVPTDRPRHKNETSQLECEKKKFYTHCMDRVLNIEFEYPSEWGSITAFLREGDIRGTAYGYQFSGAGDEAMQVVAGGRSRDFSAGRESILTDFRGYSDEKPACGNFGTSFCQEIKPGVTFEVIGGRGEYFCAPYPAIRYPKAAIWIDLPKTSAVNGFVIVGDFLASQTIDEFKSLNKPEESGLDCNRENVRLYNKKAKEIIRSVWKRELDPWSKEKIKELLYAARSIKYK